jgi:hypothetical protein
VSLADAVASMEDSRRTPPRMVVVTVDDGYQDFFSIAYPIFSAPVERSADLLNYMLRCPVAPCSAFLLDRRAEVMGYVLLVRIDDEARTAEIHIDSEDPADWHIAVALATESAAAQAPGVCEVVAGAAVPFISNSLLKNGFRRISWGPIFLHDPGHALAGIPAPNVTLIDGDMAYL